MKSKKRNYNKSTLKQTGGNNNFQNSLKKIKSINSKSSNNDLKQLKHSSDRWSVVPDKMKWKSKTALNVVGEKSASLNIVKTPYFPNFGSLKKTPKTCSFSKRRISNFDKTGFDKLERIMKKHAFFEKEDEYFIPLIIKNTRDFCKKDSSEYAFFCNNFITKCLRTPRDLHKVLYELTDVAALKLAFKKGSYPKRLVVKEIYLDHKKEFDKFIETGKIKSEKDFLALILKFLREENINSVAAFLKEVIIKTFLDYKNTEIKKPANKYTGKIIMEPYINDILKLITEGNTKQSGGSKTPLDGKTSLTDIKKDLQRKGFTEEIPLTINELKKITEEDLVEGIKTCDKANTFAEAKDEQQKKIDEGLAGNDYSNDNSEISSLGEFTENTTFLYTVLGCFLLVGIIESGYLDAPPCMTHTMI